MRIIDLYAYPSIGPTEEASRTKARYDLATGRLSNYNPNLGGILAGDSCVEPTLILNHRICDMISLVDVLRRENPCYCGFGVEGWTTKSEACTISGPCRTSR